LGHRSHLYRRVQAVRGVSPQELVRKTRLQAAAEMLARGEGNVTEVAYGVGFKSFGHFSDSFRRHFGLSPSQWQRQSRPGTARPAAVG
jgi:AraC-like DNA-binding protein